jgi:hypothetical protein
MNRKVRSFGNFLLFTSVMLIMITWAVYLFHLKYSGHNLQEMDLMLQVENTDYIQGAQIDCLSISTDQDHFSMLNLNIVNNENR